MGISGLVFPNNPKRAPRLPMCSIQSLVSKQCENSHSVNLSNTWWAVVGTLVFGLKWLVLFPQMTPLYSSELKWIQQRQRYLVVYLESPGVRKYGCSHRVWKNSG